MSDTDPNVIPPMTDPLGSYWEQPHHDWVLTDDRFAVMDKASFNILKNYSHTTPTGVYPGKMWRGQKKCGCWMLAWYGYGTKPDTCMVQVREILLLS